MSGQADGDPEGIKKVNGIINEIAASAKEQSAGVEQINRAVAT